MRMPRFAGRVALHLPAAVLLLVASGCALSSSTYPVNGPARAASDAPDRFMVGTVAPDGELSEPRPGTGCRSPMVDPRDGTRIALVQSQGGPEGEIGDYSVPAGRYGVGARELLRLDCATGRVIGIVPPTV